MNDAISTLLSLSITATDAACRLMENRCQFSQDETVRQLNEFKILIDASDLMMSITDIVEPVRE